MFNFQIEWRSVKKNIMTWGFQTVTGGQQTENQFWWFFSSPMKIVVQLMFRCYLMSQTCMFSWGLHRDTDSIRQAQPESVQIDGPWWASANNEKGTWTLRMFMELLGLPISDQMHIRQNKTCNHPKNWIVFFRWFLDYNHYVSDSDMSRFPTLSITNFNSYYSEYPWEYTVECYKWSSKRWWIW